MLVFSRYRRMLLPAFTVAVAVGVVVGVAFGGGMLPLNPAGFFGIILIAVLVCLVVAFAALLGAFAGVWLGDRRVERSPARRVCLAVLGAAAGVGALAALLNGFDDGAGAIDWSGFYLYGGILCAVVAAVCAGVMASVVEFPSTAEPSAPVRE